MAAVGERAQFLVVLAETGQHDPILEAPILLLVLEQVFEEKDPKALLLIEAVHTGRQRVLLEPDHIQMLVDLRVPHTAAM